MKKIDVGQMLAIGANFGVIAGIVFLAFELRQNNEALQTQAMLERQNVRRQILSRRQDNPALVSAPHSGRSPRNSPQFAGAKLNEVQVVSS